MRLRYSSVAGGVAAASVRVDSTGLARCVCLQRANIDWLSYHMHHKKQSTKDMMQALLGVPTYYDMLEECEMKLVGLVSVWV